MTEQTLLEKAMAAPRPPKKGRYRKDIIDRVDLAIAYIKGDVTAEQVGVALGNSRSKAHKAMGCSLITAARHGLIRIEKVKK